MSARFTSDSDRQPPKRDPSLRAKTGREQMQQIEAPRAHSACVQGHLTGEVRKMRNKTRHATSGSDCRRPTINTNGSSG